jgi:hypothetical protein
MSSPEFREVFMCKLTTATTCYSASREVYSCKREARTSHFATERHVLELQLENSRHDDDDDNDNDNDDEGNINITDKVSFVEKFVSFRQEFLDELPRNWFV